MTIRILNGDCREVLATLPAESAHCCVTSPPYWGLRDYGVAGQIGLESTYQEFVEQMVAVFREVRRVLRGDGVLWLNLGDSYASSGIGGHQRLDQLGDRLGTGGGKKHTSQLCGRAPTSPGLKPKDLCGIPWRVAFALQSDGWWLRQDIIWSKPNPMPESVTDRCTKAHEYLFLLTKAERYFYDAEAIKEATTYPIDAARAPSGDYSNGSGRNDGGEHRSGGFVCGATRNRRSVWEVATQPFSEAHFATFPPALIEPCILAGTSAKGCCAKCGAPWVRETESSTDTHRRGGYDIKSGRVGESAAIKGRAGETTTKTTGWSPSCTCGSWVSDKEWHSEPTKPCTVLDPFGGAGTTGLVADRLQRNAILIELNPQYATMAQKRIHGDAPLFAEMATP